MARQIKRIIVEGLDGAGKTVLVQRLKVELGSKVDVIVNQKQSEQDFNVWWPEQLERSDKEPVPLHDRFFYSELVYGPLIRGHISAEPILVQNMLWFLRSSAMLIYARPHSDRLLAGSKVNHQMEGVHDKFLELLNLYDELMETEKQWYKDRFIHFVWHREGEFENVVKLVRGYLSGEVT